MPAEARYLAMTLLQCTVLLLVLFFLTREYLCCTNCTKIILVVAAVIVVVNGDGFGLMAYCIHYAISPVNRAQCYIEVAVSSPVVAETIASTHCTYSHEGIARLSKPEWPG